MLSLCDFNELALYVFKEKKPADAYPGSSVWVDYLFVEDHTVSSSGSFAHPTQCLLVRGSWPATRKV